MIDEIECGKLGEYGIDLLDEKVERILENIESQEYYSLYEMVHDLYENAYMDESLVFSRDKAKDEIFDNYNFYDVCNILSDIGYDLQHPSNLYLETVHIILSENEMLEYVNDMYSEVEHEFCGELNEKETLVATIYEIGEQYDLDFVDKIHNPTYEKVKNIAVELGIEEEKDTQKSKGTVVLDDDWER
ncbi:hypothetical protein [uncultured Sneathia sp.]|uniref:hypothetical protein n=1 Tax=uncultured Sneathia sp. TaxID=278067 RepID=UPI00259B7DBE|nr:hypothetical protein [uncultured Sneathia sp.]